MNIIKTMLENEAGLLLDYDGITFAGICSKFWGHWEGFNFIKEVIKINNGDIDKINEQLFNDDWFMKYVVSFYNQNYYKPLMCKNINEKLAYCLLDYSVNCGKVAAIKALQKTVGTAQDGIIGVKTITACNGFCDSLGVEYVCMMYNMERIKYYSTLKRFKIYGKGWINRVYKVNKQVGL